MGKASQTLDGPEPCADLLVIMGRAASAWASPAATLGWSKGGGGSFDETAAICLDLNARALVGRRIAEAPSATWRALFSEVCNV